MVAYKLDKHDQPYPSLPLGSQIELAEIAEGVSRKNVCTLEVKFDPDFIEITRREQVVCDLDLFGAHTIYSRTR